MSLLSLLPILIISVGTYLLFKLKFFYIIHPKRTLKFAFSGGKTEKQIISLMLALAGTLGVGNIVGVSVGISVGGAGSVFWLAVSALFSSAIKYAEVFLSSLYGGKRGIISVIESSFSKSGRLLGKIYALIALILAFSMGCVFQSRAIAESAEAVSSFPKESIVIPVLFITVAICLLGKERIKGSVAIIIPIATLIYTIMCLYVIFSELSRIPEVIADILREAFSFKSLSGGILAFLVSSGMKEGFARGLLSNEAGAGTSSFSHTSHNEDEKRSTAPCLNDENRTNDAKRAGVFGILEVFFDTLFLCPLTALCVLLGNQSGNFSGELSEISDIFTRYLGNNASLLLLFSIIAFAVSTVMCWYYYGRVALEYLFHRNGKICYSLIFFTLFALSLFRDFPHILFIIDTSLFLLSVISLSTLMKEVRRI